jgi:NTP pyrophosphatase (non-canonical NTP hydrolase)
MITEEQFKVIDHLVKSNGEKYNLQKASEECMELALILTQKLTKPIRINDQNIIDEIGDVIIRLEILKKMFDNDKIKTRISYKLKNFKRYIDYKLYNQI